jgi:hypothetical protein
MKKDNTYTVTEFCFNCYEDFDFDIPFGTKIDDFLEDKICEKCGCAFMD